MKGINGAPDHRDMTMSDRERQEAQKNYNLLFGIENPTAGAGFNPDRAFHFGPSIRPMILPIRFV
jgi:hypothetical protein